MPVRMGHLPKATRMQGAVSARDRGELGVSVSGQTGEIASHPSLRKHAGVVLGYPTYHCGGTKYFNRDGEQKNTMAYYCCKKMRMKASHEAESRLSRLLFSVSSLTKTSKSSSSTFGAEAEASVLSSLLNDAAMR